MEAPPGVEPSLFNSRSHTRDAVICALAAVDFLEGRVMAPTECQLELARQEGWIWVRST